MFASRSRRHPVELLEPGARFVVVDRAAGRAPPPAPPPLQAPRIAVTATTPDDSHLARAGRVGLGNAASGNGSDGSARGGEPGPR